MNWNFWLNTDVLQNISIAFLTVSFVMLVIINRNLLRTANALHQRLLRLEMQNGVEQGVRIRWPVNDTR